MQRVRVRKRKKQRWKRALAMLAAVFSVFALMSPLCLAAGGGAPKAVVDAKRGVVRIFCDYIEYDPKDGNYYKYTATGSGFYIGETDKEQYFLTNWHVVSEDDGADCDEIYILLNEHAITDHFRKVINEEGEEGWAPTSRERNDESAMVKCEVVYKTTGYPDSEKRIEGLVPLRISRAQSLRDGTAVYAIGYPGSSDFAGRNINGNMATLALPAGVKFSTLTEGIVSRFADSSTEGQDTWMMQHTASINGGNSGGPLVTASGAVVGINTYTLGEHSLAIFIEYATQQLDELSIKYHVYQDWSALILPGAVCGLIAALLLFFVLHSKRPAKRMPLNPAALRLQCVSGTFAPKRFPIQNPTRIGRDPRRKDLVYPPDAAKISGAHCQLLFEDGKLYLEDLNSMNGTYRNGVKLPVMQKVPLEVGNVFSLGKDNAETFRVEVSTK